MHFVQDNKTDRQKKTPSTRQEAVAFGQNQNIICESVSCQGTAVWTVIAGNIVMVKGYGHSNQKHAF